MQTKNLAILAAVAASAATEQVQHVDVIHVVETLHVSNSQILHVSPNKRSLDVLFRRADAAECRSSARSLLLSAPTAAPEVESWALRAPSSTDPCTLVAPSSISDALIEYLTEVAEWAIEKEDDAQEIVDKCNLEGDGNALDACSTPGTLFFTSANQTKTVPLEPILESISATPGSGSGSSGDNGNAAAPRGAGLTAVVAVAMGAVGFLGFL
ncbi:uncharacterized protein NECHADRAFT_102793 [Fusarium vanettenii 77-13-4]|uniref:Infection structure specific protein n=1 Tax=Fusarium vanettenii (strain ATCC MYA-4622 / CBS 123669 / FGSC 9596 / NRRL 45880 / 77-13-4) TaxID=660122 RepID=C7Z0A1_FUSV7|nr:uncharacterized protein NECHADRAFT_102793 [Fusarium vanettenii 77-13-4]EEU42753.1 hypothetical protein NECHADRAFT_102793 [Fusarium vanettenii 77-13-4]